MKNKNIDGIRPTRNTRHKVTVRVLKIRSVVKREVLPLAKKAGYLQAYENIRIRGFKHTQRQIKILNQQLSLWWRWTYAQPRVPIMAAVAALMLAFGGGMWAVLTTTKSSASDSPIPTPQNYSIPLSDASSLGPDASVSNQVLFNMSMSQLENYFNDVAESNRQIAYEALLADRKAKLRAYLQEKNSPLADIVDTIAELKHWKIVLAISNSESSLGKHCYNNNCSGIGVDPSNPLWRDYASKREWAIDLDKLIEKRYKDWSLEQMNGVYNKPGSQNWVEASTQILEELQQREVE